jgi:hypothetical protein
MFTLAIALSEVIVRVKTVEASIEKWVRKSIMAYLEGQKNLNWIVAVVGGYAADARQMLIGLKNYGDRERYQQLSDWLASRP